MNDSISLEQRLALLQQFSNFFESDMVIPFTVDIVTFNTRIFFALPEFQRQDDLIFPF